MLLQQPVAGFYGGYYYYISLYTEHQDKRFLEAFVRENYDLTPKGIIRDLHLLDVDYNLVSSYGHFGKPGIPWEK